MCVRGPAEHYGYDDLDQLIQVDGNPTPLYETFGYDAAGNRTSDAQGTAYTYDLYMNRLLGMGGTTFAYDASGNRMSRAVGGETVTYTWDALNQLTGVSYASAGDTLAYRYDALGAEAYLG